MWGLEVMGCVYALELPLITIRIALVHSVLDELGGGEVSWGAREGTRTRLGG